MNLSCVNQYIRSCADRLVEVINNYIKTAYTPNSIDHYKRNLYFKLIYTLSYFNFTISGDTNIKYNDILHIYTFIKSQVLLSYPEIPLEDIISNKGVNQITITVDEYIGLYVYSINKLILNSSCQQLLLAEYNIKARILTTLIDKVRYKLFIQDYYLNPTQYENNYLHRLLRIYDLATYFTLFIH